MKTTENDLLRAQNPAFTHLYHKVQTLESQLGAQRCNFAYVAFIYLLISPCRELVAELKSMLRSPPAPAPTPAQGDLGHQDITSHKLSIPPTLPECDRIDFDDVEFWTKGEWLSYQRNCEERGKDYTKLGFLTDADGQSLNDDRIDSITKYARLLWNSLYKEREDPETWGVRSMFASTYFTNHMRIKFPEFQWCEGDWKVHAFATIRFPDWSQDVRKRGRLTRIQFWFYHLLHHLLISL